MERVLRRSRNRYGSVEIELPAAAMPRVRHASVGYLSEQCLFSIPFSPIPNANVDFSASLDLEIFPLGPYTRVPFLMFGWRRRHMSTILAMRRQRPAWLAPLR